MKKGDVNTLRRMGFLACAALSLFVVMALLGSDAAAAEKKFVLGWVSGDDIYPFHVRLRTSIVKHGQEAGIEVLVADAKSDVAKEVTQIETFITQSASAIATSPRDPEGSAVGVDQSWKAGIPYMAVCSVVNTKHIYVGSNDEEAGVMQANWLAEVLPKDASILYLTINPVESGAILRKKGLQKLFELRPDVKVLSEQNGQGRADLGLQITETWLQTYKDFDAIVGQNDDMVLGAYEALKAAKLDKKIITLGVDGGLDALESIQRGELTATAYQDAYGIGAAVVNVAVKIRDGANPDEIGAQIVPFQLITKDNVDKFIDLVRVD